DAACPPYQAAVARTRVQVCRYVSALPHKPPHALAVDPERIRVVVNLRHAVLSGGCVAVVADAVASSKGSRRTCDDNDRQSQHDFGLHAQLLLMLKANFLCRL